MELPLLANCYLLIGNLLNDVQYEKGLWSESFTTGKEHWKSTWFFQNCTRQVLRILSSFGKTQRVSSDCFHCMIGLHHDDVIKWKHFLRYWPFVRGIHRSPVNSPHKGQWRGALMFSLICAWINRWVNNGEAGDFRRYCTHDVIVMCWTFSNKNDTQLQPYWTYPSAPPWHFEHVQLINFILCNHRPWTIVLQVCPKHLFISKKFRGLCRLITYSKHQHYIYKNIKKVISP